uniref:Estradiol 17-beta-dehydrogenase 2 n=1 Tax=Toxocara canis TaxID=6265 RepID=A0A183TV63_TOXCA
MLLALAVSVYYIARYLWELIPIGDLSKKAIFITSCDTGFGRQLALKCAENGVCWIPNARVKLETVQLNVTKDESMKKALSFSCAVAHNAGVFSCYGPDDWWLIDDHQSSVDVNFFGMVRVTRVVSSAAGRILFPAGGPYSAVKYAPRVAHVWSKLLNFGPGIFKTNLIDKIAMERRVEVVWNRMSEEQRREYGGEYKQYCKEPMSRMGSFPVEREEVEPFRRVRREQLLRKFAQSQHLHRAQIRRRIIDKFTSLQEISRPQVISC